MPTLISFSFEQGQIQKELLKELAIPYALLDTDGNVEELDINQNTKALTHLIQLVRYAYKKNNKLKSLLKGYAQRFTLYSGQAQRNLTSDQQEIMKQIAEYIITDGAFTPMELNGFDTELWKKAIPA